MVPNDCFKTFSVKIHKVLLNVLELDDGGSGCYTVAIRYMPVIKVKSEKLQTLILSKQITLRSCPWYKRKNFSRAF